MTEALADSSVHPIQFYSSFTAYPKEVRDHLRAALRSAATGSLPRADKSFATAHDQASALASTGHLGTPAQALQRTTGIVSKWGGMWEHAGEFERAAEVYALGWEEVKGAMKVGEVGEEGVMRGAGLAMKLGDCWVRLGRGRDAEAEKAYSWAVQEMIRLGMSESQKVSSHGTGCSTFASVYKAAAYRGVRTRVWGLIGGLWEWRRC